MATLPTNAPPSPRMALCGTVAPSSPPVFAGAAAVAFTALEGLDDQKLAQSVRQLAATGPGVYSRSTSPGRATQDDLIDTQQAVFLTASRRLHAAWIDHVVVPHPVRHASAVRDALRAGQTLAAIRVLSAPPPSQDLFLFTRNDATEILNALMGARPAPDQPVLKAVFDVLYPRAWTAMAEQQDAALLSAIRHDNVEALALFAAMVPGRGMGPSPRQSLLGHALAAGAPASVDYLLEHDPDIFLDLQGAQGARVAKDLAREWCDQLNSSDSVSSKVRVGRDMVMSLIRHAPDDFRTAFADMLSSDIRPASDALKLSAWEGLLLEIKTASVERPALKVGFRL